jgi:Cu(I)/Ag(I) efflux system membrane fusion protein
MYENDETQQAMNIKKVQGGQTNNCRKKRLPSMIRIMMAILLVMMLIGCSNDTPDNADNNETAVEHAVRHAEPNFICPMHPQIIRNQADTCPLCGMDLVKQEIKQTDQGYPTVNLTADVIQKLGVRTQTVQRGALWKYIKTVGYVNYNKRRMHTIRNQTSGWVENLAVRREGLEVKKGQLLLELYSPEFLAVQEEFIAAQEKDQSGILKKYEQREESTGPRDYLRYLDVPESLANEIARSGKPRHRIPIYAPQYGVVIRNKVHKHMYVPPGYPMLTIADLSSVWVEAEVYGHQLEWVKRGLIADIEVPALSGQLWEGHVNYIYPELDPKTRTLKVRLLVPNQNGLLRPNMFARVRIYGGPKEDVLIIPREALIVTGERESVIIDRGEGKFQPVDVTTGMQSKGNVEILSGLNEGDSIVISGQFLIDSEANLQASFRRLETDRE